MPRLVLLLLLCLLPRWADAQSADPPPAMPAKAGLCLACHGAKGVPVNKAIPVISGQAEGYLYVELRDYQLGNRKNPTMQAVVAHLDKQEMKDIAAWFAAQPWPDLHQPSAAADVARRAQVAADSAVCTSCHLDGYIGDSAVPRMAGQGVDYLRATMLAFHTNQRGNNPWMSALLKTYSEDDIDALAKYLSGL